jgi:excisionase family DNA binding protein
MSISIFIYQAADMLGVSRRTVYYRIREGRLRTVRTRCGSQRVLLESILALMREDVPLLRDRAAGVSGTGPFEKSSAP